MELDTTNISSGDGVVDSVGLDFSESMDDLLEDGEYQEEAPTDNADHEIDIGSVPISGEGAINTQGENKKQRDVAKHTNKTRDGSTSGGGSRILKKGIVVLPKSKFLSWNCHCIGTDLR
ncbi:PREDICTED: uncharacterized protein LOC104788374 [Camelina sativa]|uniref:Uncharacterized protein LOC104788374 n=1 Tax=Camelina sativa TaxID=90675 RepID=A0ABM0Z9P9_CAMSA|nr:PREDICTED: uncharacterized protein LOC104788374 [Camelina sativa]